VAFGADGGPGAWTSKLGLDDFSAVNPTALVGGSVVIDPNDPTLVFASSQGNSLKKSTNGGTTWTAANSGIADSGLLYVAPLAMDPSSSQRLWTGGIYMWRTDDQTLTGWHRASSGFPANVYASAIAVAPSDPNTVFAGTNTGAIYPTTARTPALPTTTWTASLGHRANAFVSSVAFDPYNAAVGYATYSTFGTGHVYKTANGGANWAVLDGTGVNKIPDVPVHSIVVDPAN